MAETKPKNTPVDPVPIAPIGPGGPNQEPSWAELMSRFNNETVAALSQDSAHQAQQQPTVTVQWQPTSTSSSPTA